MATTGLDANNVIGVTEADLMEEQKQAMERVMEEYRQLCLKSFSMNRSREVIQK
jgi:DNA polymerase III delta prime subunit